MSRRSTKALRHAAGAALLILALGAGSPDSAVAKCSVGGGLGSTLLFPYFEVDLANPGGLTSLIAINNESGLATLARWLRSRPDAVTRPHDPSGARR